MTPVMLLDSGPRENNAFVKEEAKPIEQTLRHDLKVSEDQMYLITEKLIFCFVWVVSPILHPSLFVFTARTTVNIKMCSFHRKRFPTIF